MKFTITLLSILLTLCLAACGGNAAPPTLTGSAWVLESLNGQPIVANTLPTLAFDPEGQVSGNSSCNRFGGSYTAQAGKLSYGNLVSTMMACMEPGVMEQETAYLAALQSAASYRVADGKLLIADGAGTVTLTFAPQDLSLEGKTWVLMAFNDGNSLVSLVTDTKISAEFQDGSISGSGGCNQYGGAFKQKEQELSFAPLAVTEMACSTPSGVMEQEIAYLNALSKVTRYHVEGNQLSLYSADGLVMAEFVK